MKPRGGNEAHLRISALFKPMAPEGEDLIPDFLCGVVTQGRAVFDGEPAQNKPCPPFSHLLAWDAM